MHSATATKGLSREAVESLACTPTVSTYPRCALQHNGAAAQRAQTRQRQRPPTAVSICDRRFARWRADAAQCLAPLQPHTGPSLLPLLSMAYRASMVGDREACAAVCRMWQSAAGAERSCTDLPAPAAIMMIVRRGGVLRSVQICAQSALHSGTVRCD
jgi:hypothetical protein